MTTPDMNRLGADIRDRFAGSTITDIQTKLFNVVNEFLDFTNVWYEDVDFTLIPNQLTYTLALSEVPPGRVRRLLVVYDSTDVRLPNLYWADQASLIFPTTIQLYTRPSTAKVWVARLAKTVGDIDGDGNPAIPDWVIQQYRDDLVAGVSREFYLIPNRPWSDVKLAAHWGQQFLMGKTRARVDAIKGNTRGQQNWMFPQVFGRGSQRGV